MSTPQKAGLKSVASSGGLAFHAASINHHLRESSLQTKLGSPDATLPSHYRQESGMSLCRANAHADFETAIRCDLPSERGFDRKLAFSHPMTGQQCPAGPSTRAASAQ